MGQDGHKEKDNPRRLSKIAQSMEGSNQQSRKSYMRSINKRN